MSILAHPGVPLSFCDAAFDTAIFLINRMPSRVLNNISPYEKLFHKVPYYTILQAFGCVCFLYLRPYMSKKLLFRTITCVFLGYGSNHKGFKCFDPITKRIYMSRHVVFDEMVFPFITSNTLQPSSSTTALHDQVLLRHCNVYIVLTTVPNSTVPTSNRSGPSLDDIHLSMPTSQTVRL